MGHLHHLAHGNSEEAVAGEGRSSDRVPGERDDLATDSWIMDRTLQDQRDAALHAALVEAKQESAQDLRRARRDSSRMPRRGTKRAESVSASDSELRAELKADPMSAVTNPG